ncbi:MAG: methylmalonyl-CoA carboxyltransferase [Blastocatellia bacterium]|nr:methylmalonyl-CoA carboxyltransferase [Blastocatellia bacterium]
MNDAPELEGIWQAEVEELRQREELAREMGGPEKVAKHQAQGKLTVRERIDAVLDIGSFHEVGALAGTGEYEGTRLKSFIPANFVCGTGSINGRKVVVGGDDFTVRGGAADAAIIAKQIYAEQMANSLKIPMVRLVDGTGGGGSVKLLEKYGFTYVPFNPGWDLVVENMSLVPVAAACLGSVAGLGSARLVMSHFSVMVEKTAQVMVAGPPVVKFGTGEQVTKEDLGGAQVHRTNGAVDMVVPTEMDALTAIRRFLSYLPQNVFQLPPVEVACDPADRREPWLLSAIPRNRRHRYKIRPILEAIFDEGSLFEMACYGGSTVTALARLDGKPVGVAASDCFVGGGALSVEGAEALIRLADLCDTFHLPLVMLTDQPGIAIGRAAERRGVIRHGARAIAAIYQARVPAAEVILRRVYGVGGAGASNRHRFVQRFAWPSGDWGSLPLEGGIEAAYRRELESSPDPARLLAEINARLDAVRSPFRTAEHFGIEEIIDPQDTRPLLCEWVRDAYELLPSLLGRPARGTRP